MINVPQNQGMPQQPLYGPGIPQDAIVRALMGGQISPQAGPSPIAAGLGGLSPQALMSLAKYFKQPSPQPYTPANVGGVGNLAVMQGAGAAGT